MSSRPLFRSPISALAFAGLVVLGLAVVKQSSNRARERANLPDDCQGLSPQECLAGPAQGETPGSLEWDVGSEPGDTFLQAGDVCVDVGYLCAEVETNGSVRLLRWPAETPVIRVWVPEPTGLSPELAREFQRAAVRGIRAWHDHPIPLSIRTRQEAETPDITVEWAQVVEDGRLGRAGVEWMERGGDVTFTVVALVLATHHPADSQQELSPQQVELVATHEMGHALGLPHSDSPRDVMFPTNTATRLTARDFRTLEAVYSLPNGAEIRR